MHVIIWWQSYFSIPTIKAVAILYEIWELTWWHHLLRNKSLVGRIFSCTSFLPHPSVLRRHRICLSAKYKQTAGSQFHNAVPPICRHFESSCVLDDVMSSVLRRQAVYCVRTWHHDNQKVTPQGDSNYSHFHEMESTELIGTAINGSATSLCSKYSTAALRIIRCLYSASSWNFGWLSGISVEYF